MNNIDEKMHHFDDVLTDLRDGQYVFLDAFINNLHIGSPIKTVLELGVYRIYDSIPKDFPGQSTKILTYLCSHFNIEKFVSLDIDNECQKTIDHCRKWCQERGVIFNNHKFIISNSMEYDIIIDFPNGIDFIFLDTNHDDNYPENLGFKNSGGAGMTYKELCYYAPHLTRNGRLFIHDTKNYYVPRGYGFNTDGAIQKFIDKNPDFGFIEHSPNDNGLGELYRLNSEIGKIYKERL